MTGFMDAVIIKIPKKKTRKKYEISETFYVSSSKVMVNLA